MGLAKRETAFEGQDRVTALTYLKRKTTNFLKNGSTREQILAAHPNVKPRADEGDAFKLKIDREAGSLFALNLTVIGKHKI